MSPELQIRTELAKYLVGDLALDEFTEWFVQTTWDEAEPIYRGSLVQKIELVFAEFTNGHLTEDELKDRLRPFMTADQIYEIGGALRVETSSTSTPVSSVPYSSGYILSAGGPSSV